MIEIWEDVKAEVAAMEAWNAAAGWAGWTNIYVGWDTALGGSWYAGMSEGGEIVDEVGQHEASTPEEALRSLLTAAREYRERIDRERAEDEQDEAILETVDADPSVMERPL